MRRLTSLCFAVLAGLVPAGDAAAASRGAIVAVLDSGVDLKHPDLKGSAWRNPRERRNGRDDDGNGFVDDVNGADMVNADGNPRDPRGHGTHVAGIVARGGARIMAVRIIGRDGTGTGADLARGIDYAVANGARVINLSVSHYGAHADVAAALSRASAAGVVVVAAAGNSGTDLDATPIYPASYRTPGMVVVGAAGRDGRIMPWSGHGAKSVDLVAPGVAIRSALPGRRHGRKSGTSQAAAQVSRAIARALAASPTASPAQVRDALLGAGARLDVRGTLSRLLG